MSRTGRILGAVLMVLSVLLVVSTALTGVVLLDGIRVAHHTSRTLVVGPAPAVTVRGDAAGVSVVAGAPGQVVVEEDVHAQALTRVLAEQTVRGVMGDVSGTTSTVDVRADRFFCCTSSLWVSDVSATLFLRLPPDASLLVDTGSGDVRVSGMSGPVDVTTDSGDVTLAGLTTTGSVQVRSQSGSVDLSGALRGGRFDVQTDSGRIGLGLPSDTDARLSAATESGSITIDRTWPVAASSRAVTGTLGSGAGGSIRLQTSSGDIRVGAR